MRILVVFLALAATSFLGACDKSSSRRGVALDEAPSAKPAEATALPPSGSPVAPKAQPAAAGGRDVAGSPPSAPPPSPGSLPRGSTPFLREVASAVTGGLPPGVVLAYIRNTLHHLRGCYGEGLLREPDLHGEVSLRFVVDLEGRIQGMADAGSKLPDPSVTSCLMSTLRKGLVFPAPDGMVQVSYRMDLSPVTLDAAPPPFPSSEWVGDTPSTPDVTKRAVELLSELWRKGDGSTQLEEVGGRWVTFVAVPHAGGKKGINVYRRVSQGG